jgi:hypothetical protein
MMTIEEVRYWLNDQKLNALVQTTWEGLHQTFLTVQEQIPPEHRMARKEISFHDHVRLLGSLTVMCEEVQGDILEIGVWKGKSLTLMHRLAENSRKVYGIDPLELPNQAAEQSYYNRAIYPDVQVLRSYSERAVPEFEKLSKKLAILHIDGGHLAKNVLLDFLLYEEFVSPGGYIVFDDYKDYRFSPEVGPAVDLLRIGGFFNKYDIFGVVPGFNNSYLLRKVKR